MSVTDYTTKIKEICDALGSINVTVDKYEMVQICLVGLVQRYGPIRMVICTRQKPPSFFDLQSMLMVEENHVSGSRTTQSENEMLYTEANRPLGVEDEVDRHAMGAADKNRKIRHRDSANYHRHMPPKKVWIEPKTSWSLLGNPTD